MFEQSRATPSRSRSARTCTVGPVMREVPESIAARHRPSWHTGRGSPPTWLGVGLGLGLGLGLGFGEGSGSGPGSGLP